MEFGVSLDVCLTGSPSSSNSDNIDRSGISVEDKICQTPIIVKTFERLL